MDEAVLAANEVLVVVPDEQVVQDGTIRISFSSLARVHALTSPSKQSRPLSGPHADLEGVEGIE